MLNFAEQTGSGAVIVVWSFLPTNRTHTINNRHNQTNLLSTIQTLLPPSPLHSQPFPFHFQHHISCHICNRAFTNVATINQLILPFHPPSPLHLPRPCELCVIVLCSCSCDASSSCSYQSSAISPLFLCLPARTSFAQSMPLLKDQGHSTFQCQASKGAII